MSLACPSRVALLQDRAQMLASARAFFAQKKILEVDVPILSETTSVDTHIDLIEANCMGRRCFLHSSPEYGMKRLLAEGSGDIYQLSHVFRDGEKGERHNPEFMMAEWYRIGFSFEEMIEETIEFIRLFLDVNSTYEFYPFPEMSLEEFAFEVEPKLGWERISVVIDFPPELAALSQVRDGVALRFEIFYRGMELANGYHELIDPVEQRQRLEKANREREALDKPTYPIDEQFLEALEQGIPDCCGVAVGFDRLMMLRHNVDTIDEAIACSLSI